MTMLKESLTYVFIHEAVVAKNKFGVGWVTLSIQFISLLSSNVKVAALMGEEGLCLYVGAT